MENGELSTSWVDSLAAFFPGLQVLAGDVDNAVLHHFFYYTIWERYSAHTERFQLSSQQTAIPIYPLRPELIESTYMLYQVDIIVDPRPQKMTFIFTQGKRC